MVSLSMTGSWNWMITKGPSNPTHSVIIQPPPKSRECSESSSSLPFSAAWRPQGSALSGCPQDSTWSCCWSRGALSKQEEEAASLAQTHREETQHRLSQREQTLHLYPPHPSVPSLSTDLLSAHHTAAVKYCH